MARKPAVHLFSGLTYCACDGKMYVPSNNPKYTCQKCRQKIPVDDLEAIYQEQLKDFLLSEDDLYAYLHQADDVITQNLESLGVLEKERADLWREMDKVYALFMGEQISQEGFGRKYGPLEERLSQIDSQIPKLQSEIDFLKIKNLSEEQILADAKDLYSRWSTLSREEQQQIVETITDSIIVKKDEVSINFHYLPFFLAGVNMATNPLRSMESTA